MSRGSLVAFLLIATMAISFASARAQAPTMAAQQRCAAVYLVVSAMAKGRNASLYQRADSFFNYSFDHIAGLAGQAKAKQQIMEVAHQIAQEVNSGKVEVVDALLQEMKSCENVIAPP
jgi:hypothetical protein